MLEKNHTKYIIILYIGGGNMPFITIYIPTLQVIIINSVKNNLL